MPDQEKFAGWTLSQLESADAYLGDAHQAVKELITAYKLVLLERDVAVARLELLRKAAGGQ